MWIVSLIIIFYLFVDLRKSMRFSDLQKTLHKKIIQTHLSKEQAVLSRRASTAMENILLWRKRQGFCDKETRQLIAVILEDSISLGREGLEIRSQLCFKAIFIVIGFSIFDFMISWANPYARYWSFAGVDHWLWVNACLLMLISIGFFQRQLPSLWIWQPKNTVLFEEWLAFLAEKPVEKPHPKLLALSIEVREAKYQGKTSHKGVKSLCQEIHAALLSESKTKLQMCKEWVILVELCGFIPLFLVIILRLVTLFDQN